MTNRLAQEASQLKRLSHLIRRTTAALSALGAFPDLAAEVQSFKAAAELWESLRTVGLSNIKVEV